MTARKGEFQYLKIVKNCSANEVWSHWRRVEGFSNPYFRWDVRGILPSNIESYFAQIEEKDLEKMFFISSDDWKKLSETFRLFDVVDAIDHVDDEKVKNILDKEEIYQKDIDALDRKFILVAPSIKGNFTIIEGNKRAVALQRLGKLVGNQIYLGISNGIKEYWWARYSV